MGELTSASALDLAAAIRGGKVSSKQVVTAYLHRIEAVNPRLNAIVQLAAERSLEEARQADAALARGKVLGPLHGVPFTAKDVFETAGIICAAGLEERAHLVPASDAVVVARMRASGAILLGKTNCPPGGGGGVTDNPVYGRTNNPYDLCRTPGGSSGGEAAAIAAGESALGIGSDSGGSIRVPAHLCGIAGLKPTSGRVPNTGVLNHPGGLTDYRTQIGPMARYVRDLAAAFAIIAGEDGIDSGIIPMPVTNQVASTKGLRVAFYVDDGQAVPTEDTVSTVRAAVRALADGGLVVQEARPSCLTDSRPITERYWSMCQLPGTEVEQMFLDWDRFRTAMLAFIADYDAILCPTDYQPASPHDQEPPRRFNYTLPFSLCGWPCTVVRAGTSATGLPIGVQIAARPWREDVALAVAQVIEDALGGWQPPAL
jgi:amidase